SFNSVKVTISKPGATKVVVSQATVSDSDITVTALDFNPLEGKNFSGSIATFTDADLRKPGRANYVATIDWGDGSVPTLGNIVPNSLGAGFSVSGNHLYGAGQYTAK